MRVSIGEIFPDENKFNALPRWDPRRLKISPAASKVTRSVRKKGKEWKRNVNYVDHKSYFVMSITFQCVESIGKQLYEEYATEIYQTFRTR